MRALFAISGLKVLSTTYGLNGGSVRAVSVPGPPESLDKMALDDPMEIQQSNAVGVQEAYRSLARQKVLVCDKNGPQGCYQATFPTNGKSRLDNYSMP